jgi:hypothetical protein
MSKKAFLAFYGAFLIMACSGFSAFAATLNTLTVDKQNITGNRQEIQTATLVLDSTNPAAISRVSILVNYLDNSNNANRGYLGWNPAQGFL